MQIELKEKSVVRATNSATSVDGVYLPRAGANPVIAALTDRELYKQSLGSGKHDITCPWVWEHTDQVDGGTAYFEPSEIYPIGGFKCLHGHCSHRHVSALLDFLSITQTDAKHLPNINVQAGEINRIVDIAEFELSKTGHHYQRGSIIVTVATDPQTKATNVKTLSLQSLTRDLAGLAVWWRFDNRKHGWVVCDPPEKHTRILHDATQYLHLPILNGIARQPYLRPDGSLVALSGYDGQTGMLGFFNSHDFTVPERPTKEQARTALLKLDALLSEFTFKNTHDKAAALSAILTAVIRQSLRLAPMFHISAPQIASGKSYLCELVTLFATPEKATPHSFPSDDDEMRKLLLSELLTAPAVVEFDNLTCDLMPHNSLCTVLTSEYVRGRILGQSMTTEVGTRAMFLSSGNNVEPVRDMTRRTVSIKLDPKCETPATRDFKNNPVGEVRNKRAQYISYALTIIRAWIVAGKPKTEVKPLNSYEGWSELCRHPLLWLGFDDPATGVFETMAHDPDREDLGNFLGVCFEIYDTRPFKVADLVWGSAVQPNLKEVMPDFCIERDGRFNNKRLGRWIKRQNGRIVNGLCLRQDTRVTGNVVQWRVESNEAPRIASN